MLRSALLTVLTLLASTATFAQTCLGFTIKPNSGYEIDMFNARDKLTGKMMYTIKGVRRDGANTVVDVNVQTSDEKGRNQSNTQVSYTCNGNMLIVDMSGTMPNNTSFKDAEMKIIANDIGYPGRLAEGTTLKDGAFQSEMYTSGTKMVDMNFLLTNRKVESKQDMNTPAGQFTVYKITSDAALKTRTMGIPINSNFQIVSYRTNELLFDVRSETYRNGKLMSYQVLSRVF